MCKCWSLQNMWYFLAGIAFWEALVHLSLQFSGALPLTLWGVAITATSNHVIIGSAALLFFLFLYLGHSGACCKPDSKDSSCC